MLKEFQQSIDNAFAQHGTKREGWVLLNQVIVGPLQSKKAFAWQYSQELLNRGFVNDTPLEVPPVSTLSDEDLGKFFTGGRGRVMIIEVEKDMSLRSLLISDIARAIQDQGSIIVLTGTRENVEALMTDRPFLRNLLKNFVSSGEPTPAEQEQRRKQGIVAQWREMRDFDISVGHDIAAPEKATFAKKNPRLI